MKHIILALFVSTILLSCKDDKKTDQPVEQNITESEVNEEEWIHLFDGTSTEGWRAYNGETLPSGWVIKNGELTFDTEIRTEANRQGGKDIVYAAEEFDNFELYWEWKIPEGGNSGMMYHVNEGEWPPYEVSPEYQMLDDLKWEEINNDTLADWQKTGADYAMYVPDESQKIVKPAMEWNTSRIIFTPEKVEHWLNGKKLLEFVPWSEDWETRKKIGKWKDYPKYGTFKSGYISIQDHDSPLWLRNIKIKKL